MWWIGWEHTPFTTTPKYFLGHKEHSLLIPNIRKLSPQLWNQTNLICMVNETFTFSLVPFTVDDKLWRDFWIFLQEKFFSLFPEKSFLTDSKAKSNRTNLGILNIQALNLALHIFSLENRRNASFYRTGFWRLKIPTLFSNRHNLPNCVTFPSGQDFM